jgi:hypothetical protein
MEKISKNEVSLEQLDTHKLADTILKHASESKNEEELKIRVETTLRPILEKWGIRWASYEHRHEISGVRKDALYGLVIIEYKKPGELESKSKFIKFKEKLKEYITKEAVDPKYFGRWVGIIIDGYKISFVRFRKNQWEEPEKPLPINKETIKTLLRAIRGLQLRVIEPDVLVSDFWPGELSKQVIYRLYASLLKSKSKRTQMLFEDWKRVFLPSVRILSR